MLHLSPRGSRNPCANAEKSWIFPIGQRYSAWQQRDKLDSMCGLISTGRMPPWLYTTIHPEAKLTEEDKNAVCDWVKEQKEQTVAAR
jgi:hypothetical protein